MTLNEQWRELTGRERNKAEHDQFWNAYFELETENYKKILSRHETPYAGTLNELAVEFGMDEVTFLGFLDGINSSLTEALELDELDSGSQLELRVDYEKLYTNMLDAKAQWLYTLSEWDNILSEQKRRELTQAFRASKVFVRDGAKVGRNDPCPCGSGKKFKNCCQKNN